jgi:hypothetical protein
VIFIFRTIYSDMAGIVLCCFISSDFRHAKYNNPKQDYLSAIRTADSFGVIAVQKQSQSFLYTFSLSELCTEFRGKKSSFKNAYQVTARR